MNTNATKSSSKIDRNALKDALKSVVTSLGLKPANKLSDEEKASRKAAKAAKRSARLAPIVEGVRTGKRQNGKKLITARRIEMALTLAKNGVPIPEEFFKAFPQIANAADALVAAGELRKIDKAAVLNAFRLPGGVKVQVAPVSGGAIVSNIADAPAKKARRSA